MQQLVREVEEVENKGKDWQCLSTAYGVDVFERTGVDGNAFPVMMGRGMLPYPPALVNRTLPPPPSPAPMKCSLLRNVCELLTKTPLSSWIDKSAECSSCSRASRQPGNTNVLSNMKWQSDRHGIRRVEPSREI
eukprot:g81032.t1